MTGRAAPPITVAIPFHDEAGSLGDAIRSLLAQTESDFELLLVDDGSRDESLDVARSFRDPRITIHSDGERRYLPARLNEIAKRARGDFVARMDADDISHPDRLRAEVDVLRNDATVDAVGTWAGLVDASGAVFAVAESAALPPTPMAALEHGILAHATMVARRRWLLANPYDERLTRTEDRDLWCRTASTARFAVVPRPLYVVRLCDGPGFVADYVEAQRQHRRILRERGPAMVGTLRTVRLMASSHAKALVMRAAGWTHLVRRVVHRRGRPPTRVECALIEEAIAAALQRA
jgi:glycosyltransferase involved in cell wall biosynthesis